MGRIDQSEKTPKAINAGAEASIGQGPLPSTIDQVRDLLFGGAQRSIEQHLSDIREALEASNNQLRSDFNAQISQLEAKLAALERNTEDKHSTTVQQIGAAISQLGSTVSSLGEARKGR